MRRGEAVKQPDSFPNVKQGHVLPRVLQANWAVGGMVDVRLAGTTRSFRGNINDVGTRRRAYQRVRPNGEKVDDTEWSLSVIESAVQPVLRDVEALWPLPDEERATLAEFIAVQIVRGPNWWADRARMVREVADEARRGRITAPAGSPRAISEADIETSEAWLLDNTLRDTDMLRISRKLCSVLSGMTWSLLKFEQDVVALSDHPVVVWPAKFDRWSRGFASSAAMIDALEIRMPLGPQLALLMTWRDAHDDRHPLTPDRRHARSLNELTIAQADKHWLWKPGSSPLRGTGTMKPISPTIWRAYSRDAVYRSKIRRQLQALMKEAPLATEPLTASGEFTVIRPRVDRPLVEER